MRRATIVMAAAFAIASQSAAQQSPSSGSTAGSCRATLEIVPGESITDTLFLALDPGYGLAPLPEEVTRTTLSVIADSLVLPTPLPMPPVMAAVFGGSGDAPHGGVQGLMGEAFVELDGKGQVKHVGLSQTTLVPRLDSALLVAVKSGVNNGAFMGFDKAARGRGGYVFIALRSIALPEFRQQAADYVKQPLAGTPLQQTPVPKKAGAVTFPVRVLQIPIIRLTSGASIPKPGPQPIFPTREQSAGQEGFVNVEFVIGADGRVIPGTFRLANAMTAGYAHAVQKAVENYTFTPATANGCGVPQRLTYTFTFELY